MKWPSRNAPVRFRICIKASWEGISSTMRLSCFFGAQHTSIRYFSQLARRACADRVANLRAKRRVKTSLHAQLPSFVASTIHQLERERALQLVLVFETIAP